MSGHKTGSAGVYKETLEKSVVGHRSIIDRPLKVIELFAGVGAPRMALTNLGIPHTSVISEIDKHAVKSYNAIHGDTPNLGDISKIERLPECDLLTYGFPCQDISMSGNQKGFSVGSCTRSGLLWEVKRLINGASERPDILIMENVANILSVNFLRDFKLWISTLSDYGYTSTYKILNAKDYGVPQNRERCFMVSCLNGRSFDFPKGRMPNVRLNTILERDVPERYYLSPEQVKRFTPAGRSTSLSNGLIVAGNLNNPSNIEHGNRVYDSRGLSPTAMTSHGTRIKIIDNTRKGYLEAVEGDTVNLSVPGSTSRRARVQNQASCTLMTNGRQVGVVVNTPAGLWIRYLTELEYWRLQGLAGKDDVNFDRAAGVSSSTQLYKQAGNSIAVPVMEAILRELYLNDRGHSKVRHITEWGTDQGVTA